jgi:hypothetical protein
MCEKASIPATRDSPRTRKVWSRLPALALGLALSALSAAPAAADSFFFGFNSGYRPAYGYGGRYDRHHDYDRHRDGYGYGRRHGYFGPRIVFLRPPVYYAPPPRVVYRAPVYAAPAPVYSVAEPLRANPAGPSYRSASGQTCREYQTTVNVGGRLQEAYGTACLQPDGDWRVVD